MAIAPARKFRIENSKGEVLNVAVMDFEIVEKTGHLSVVKLTVPLHSAVINRDEATLVVSSPH